MGTFVNSRINLIPLPPRATQADKIIGGLYAHKGGDESARGFRAALPFDEQKVVGWRIVILMVYLR